MPLSPSESVPSESDTEWATLLPIITQRIHSHPLEVLSSNDKGQTAVYLLVSCGCPRSYVLRLLHHNPHLLEHKTNNGSLVVHKMASMGYPTEDLLKVLNLRPRNVDVPCPWLGNLPVCKEVLLREKRLEVSGMKGAVRAKIGFEKDKD